MTHEDMKNLANLARMELSDIELDNLAHDFDSILGYVDQINQVVIPITDERPLQMNTVRDDEHPHASGSYNDTMIAGAPDSQDGFYKVPKIL